jgi:hypothetical protein
MERLLTILPSSGEAPDIRLSPTDALITAAGFEDRALAAIRSLASSSSGNLVVLTYSTGDKRNHPKAFISEARAKALPNKNITFVDYDRFEPHAFHPALRKCLEAIKVSKVILDISAMSKLTILLCLDVCRRLKLTVSVYYAEALDYGPSEQGYLKAREENAIHRPSMQIYSGVQAVLRVSPFSSVAMQGQPTAAIAFMSFNDELIQALLNCVSPARLFLINGRPPLHRWRERATAWIHEQLIREWPEADNPVVEGLPIRATSTLNYKQTVATLCELYWQLNVHHRVVLAPTGSKMQAVACFLAVAMHPDIQIEYPTPQGFLDLYSKGVGRKWLVEFGNLQNLVEQMILIERGRHLGFNAISRPG